MLTITRVLPYARLFAFDFDFGRVCGDHSRMVVNKTLDEALPVWLAKNEVGRYMALAIVKADISDELKVSMIMEGLSWIDAVDPKVFE
jgi:hypothetical protein